MASVSKMIEKRVSPVVLEPKDSGFSARWIDAGDAVRGDMGAQVFWVRRIFSTTETQAWKRVYVSADSQYILWVNGEIVHRGPAHFDPTHQNYDTLDLSPWIREGENCIAAQIIYWSPTTRLHPFHQLSIRPGFLFESSELRSDAEWKTLASRAHRSAGKEMHRGGGAGNWYEHVDGRHWPVGFETLDFEDADWLPAREIANAECWGAQHDTSSPWKLIPRSLPGMEVRPAESCLPLQSGNVIGRAETPPFLFAVKPDKAAPQLPHVLPGGDETRYLVLSAGCLVNGYVELDLEGPAGAEVEVVYAEAPERDRKKGRRDVLENRRVEGSGDVYVLREGRQIFRPALYRTFWYVRIAVRSAAPVTVHGLQYQWTGYPFPEDGAFECSDELLNRIWQVGWNTQRLCAFDTFQDCPYYERLQYGGDTRIQGLISLYASGDARLLANAVRQMNASHIPEGLTQSRYPNSVYQVIPGFSLYWIMMIQDYYWHTGDLALVRECAGGIQSVLQFYEDHRKENGFLANLPYWNFYDWAFERGGVPNAHAENCTLSTMHYKGVLDIATDLFKALDEPLLAQRYAAWAQDLQEKVNAAAWDENAGLYTDGVATKTLSQHVNVFAVLFGFADEARSKRIAQRLFDDNALRHTTFYFAHYLHEVALRLGQPHRIFDDMARWRVMLDQGTTTWWETPGNPRSECHAWSATPTYRLMTTVLGVQPTAPGFRHVSIRPQFPSLDFAQGTVPTPHGPIQVHWEKPDTFTLEVTLPEGVTADIILPSGTRHRAHAGVTRVVDA